MQRIYVCFFSTILLAALVFSPLMIFGKSKKKSCPIPPPKTLLSLYLQSDVIVAATIKKVKDVEILQEDEDGTQVSIKQTLQVSTTFKGQKLPVISLYGTEYREKVVASDEEDTDDYGNYGYRGISKLKVGEKYLFFLRKDDETNRLELTDYQSAIRDLSEDSTGIYEKRLKELGLILGSKKNQLPQIGEWLVKCAEEPITRWDGLFDLNRSFNTLNYESDDEEIADAPPEIPVIDEDFSAGDNSEIAKILTNSQKERLSGLFFNLVTQLSSQPDLLEKESYFYHSSSYYLANIVKNWDKAQFAIQLFGMLQSINNSNKPQILYLMNLVNQIIDDEQLSDISERYGDSLEKEDTDAVIEEVAKKISSEETENNQANVETANTDTSIEIADSNDPKVVVAGNNVQTVITDASAGNSKAETMTFKILREKLLQDFVGRYQILVTRGFNTADK